MRFLFALTAILSILLLMGYCQADLVVTNKDVEIRFPDADPAAEGAWTIIEITEVSYWARDPGVHEGQTKLGKQVWEGLLQEDQPELGIVQFSITVLSLPNIAGKNAPARRMELRFRVRNIVDGKLRAVGKEFSVANYIDIIGKPGTAAMKPE